MDQLGVQSQDNKRMTEIIGSPQNNWLISHRIKFNWKKSYKTRLAQPLNSNIYWECRYLRRGECRARATLVNVNNKFSVIRESEHDHLSNQRGSVSRNSKAVSVKRLSPLIIRTKLAGR